MASVKPSNSCRGLFKRSEISLLPCEYIFSLMKFSVYNQEHFQTNSAAHSVNTRNKYHIHRPICSFSYFEKVHAILCVCVRVCVRACVFSPIQVYSPFIAGYSCSLGGTNEVCCHVTTQWEWPQCCSDCHRDGTHIPHP
jgi:hypothetical protein